MVEEVPHRNRDRGFFLLLIPLAVVSVPSLIFCALAVTLWVHGWPAGQPITLHLPPRSGWDAVFALELSAYRWVARWNWVATLAATAFFVSTLLRPRWRHWTGLALIPYGLLLCADFTLRWRYALLP
jgi:hypothetical protein